MGWNVIGVVVVAIAALTARSVPLAGFGLDSLIEIFASVARPPTCWSPQSHPRSSPLGIGWTAVTCAVMLGLAGGKIATGKALGQPGAPDRFRPVAHRPRPRQPTDGW